MIELKGLNGESLLLADGSLTKFRHNGLDETARNPVSTYREVQVKHKPGKRGKEGRYDLLVAMSSIMSISVPESAKSSIDDLVAALEETRER